MQDAKKRFGIRIDAEIVDFIEELGEGNKTRGVEILYECYRNNGHGVVGEELEGEADIEKLFFGSIRLPASSKQREGYITIVTDYLMPGGGRASLQHYKYLLGYAGRSDGSAKTFFKGLVSSKFLAEHNFLFRPKIRPRNNVPKDLLLEYMERYRNFLRTDVADDDDVLTGYVFLSD